ncbi:MAG: GGDEF domain-containing protein [Oscillospiraceae bacterium]
MIRSFLENEGKKGVHALLIIDIDNFKTINDSQGHLFGDSVLASIAAVIGACFRITDIVGRIGGDEFVVFLKNVRSKSNIQEKARQVCQAFRQLRMQDGRKAAISGSIGIALCEHGNMGYEKLFQMADNALYSAKKRGKNRYDFYREGMKMPSLPCSVSKIDSDGEQQTVETP